MCGLIALAALLVVVLIIKFLPWYGSVGVFVSLGASAWFFRGPIVYWICTTPFRMKARALRGATATVHSLTRIPPPKPTAEELADEEEEDARDRAHRRYFSLQVTIAPKPNSGPFQHWDVDDLTLTASSARFGLKFDDDSCRVVDTRIDTPILIDPSLGEGAEADVGGKVVGEHRLTMQIGVKPGVEALKFQYYMVSFGSVAVPKD